MSDHDAHPSTVPAPSDLLPRVETLPDGTRVQLAFLGPSDRQDLVRGMRGLSRESRFLRFFSYLETLPKGVLDGLVNTDGTHHVAVAARLVEGEVVQPPIVGVARYFLAEGNTRAAEPAVAVIDSLHGRGLGKLLLRTLSRVARKRGITHFRAHALASNERIRQILRAADGHIVDHDGPVLVYDVDIRPRHNKRPRRGLLSRLLTALVGR